jgi:predicted ATPase
MKLTKIYLKNFKSFKNTTMQNIPHFNVIIGANGTGKSSLLQVFTFLKEAFISNINTAFSKIGGSKGFLEIRSRNTTGNIEIEIQLRENKNSAVISYFLSIAENKGVAFIEREILKYKAYRNDTFLHLLDFSNGSGSIVINNNVDKLNNEDELHKENKRLKSNDILALKAFAQFENFSVAMTLGNFFEKWHISDININNARQEKETGYSEHLSIEGDNLPLVTKYLYQRHPELFKTILKKLTERVPGIEKVEAKTTEDSRVLLRFREGPFHDPFHARYVSDGTIKMFAYLVLLYDPKPHSLLCLEEPEKQLYPKLLWELAEEFRAYTIKGGQVFIATHSPEFLNAIELDEVFWLVKNNGYTTIKRASDDNQLSAFMANGDQMGYLWEQGFFEGVDSK